MKEKFIVACNLLNKWVPQSEVHGPFHCQYTAVRTSNLPEVHGKTY